MVRGKMLLRPAQALLVVVSSSLIGAACSDPMGPPPVCDPDGPGPSIAGARRDSVPPPPTGRHNLNDEWADIARQVPGGWGGAFLVNGQFTMYLVQPDRREKAIAALISLGFGNTAVRGAEVWQGRWDFAQLYDWRRYINLTVGWREGLVFSDLDEFQNRIVFGVRGAEAAGSVEALLDALHLPCELVVLEVE